MTDLTKLTVRALRELARKHVGAGYSRLRSRGDLIAALAKVLPRQTHESRDRGEPTISGAATGKRKAAAKLRSSATSTRGKKRRSLRRSRRVKRSPKTRAPVLEPLAKRAALVKHAASRTSVEPLLAFDEQLGELPESYGEDSVVLLPKDPQCLYLYWDLTPDTLERAFAWMPGARTRLRLLEGERPIREVDFSLEAKSWWFEGLAAGRTYKAELLVYAEDGQVRRIGPASNPMRLPSGGPSHIRDDRFVRIPFELPARRIATMMRNDVAGPGGPERPVAASEKGAQARFPLHEGPATAPRVPLAVRFVPRAQPVPAPWIPPAIRLAPRTRWVLAPWLPPAVRFAPRTRRVPAPWIPPAVRFASRTRRAPAPFLVIRFVAPPSGPDFSEEARERIYVMSGGKHPALPSSQSQACPT